MAQSTLSVRMDEETKKQFDVFCNEVGMNPSVAINLFVKATLRERKIPFEIAAPDPFFSVENHQRLLRAAHQMEHFGGSAHELIEAQDD